MSSTRSLRYAAALVALLVVPLALRGVLHSLAVGAMGPGGGFPWWLPQFGTVGQTVAAYGLLVSLVTSLVIPLALFALGYRFGRRRARGTGLGG